MRRLGVIIAASATVLTGWANQINLDAQQVPDDVKQAVKKLPSAEVKALGKDRVPTMIHGYLGRIDGMPDSTKIHKALPEIAAAFRLKSDELKVAKAETDKLGITHYRFEQTIKGLPVIGASFSVHLHNKSGRISSANGNARSVDIERAPKIKESEAEKAALDATKNAEVVGKTELVYVVSSRADTLHLAYRVELKGKKGALLHDFVFIDALDGKLVARHPQIHDARNRETYDAGNTSTTATLVRNESSGPSGDNVVDVMHNNAAIVYDFYAGTFGRDSIDGAGMTIKSFVRYYDDRENGSGPNNAFWGSGQLLIGNGDGVVFGPFVYALDIIAHEFAHGVTEYSSGLIYSDEPGALNESMSDIMGAMCEATYYGLTSNTWKIGEEVWTPGNSGDALRYMDSPTLDFDPLHQATYGNETEYYSRDWYPDRYTGFGDNGGVHFNSGIPNLAFKLLVTGGAHPRGMSTIDVPGIGKDMAQQIFYRANQYYAGPGSSFHDFRQYTAQAAADLYGSSAEYSTNAAWAAVGVGSLPASIQPQGSASPSTAAFGQIVTLTQAAQASAGVAWTENVIWQPNGQPDVLGNKGLGSINYMPHAGPGTYWYQIRVVDNAYNYQDQWISFTVEAPSGYYLTPAAWVSPAVPISYGNSVTLYPFGMASVGVAWTENVIWQPDGQPVVLGDLGVGGATTYTPSGGPGLYWYLMRLVDNDINFVDQWSSFYVAP